MTLKTRLDALEQAQVDAELDRYARYFAERYREPFADVRRQIEAKARAMRAEGTRVDDPETRRQIEALHREMAEWEERGRA